MNIKEIAEALDLKLFNGQTALEREVSGAYVCDLLSDVMGFAHEGDAWITLQSHINVVAIASLKDMPLIILVKGVEPEPSMLKKATEEGIAVAGTRLGTFELTGKLYKLISE